MLQDIVLFFRYYRGSQGVILVYDVTNSDSFLHVQNWLRDFEKSADGDRVKKILGMPLKNDHMARYIAKYFCSRQ